MEGRYTHIVLDGLDQSIYYELSVCSLGIMGTKYVRSEDPITETVITRGESFFFNMVYIYSDINIPIGNDLTIEIISAVIIDPLVTLDKTIDPSYTQVTIDTSSMLVSG